MSKGSGLIRLIFKVSDIPLEQILHDNTLQQEPPTIRQITLPPVSAASVPEPNSLTSSQGKPPQSNPTLPSQTSASVAAPMPPAHLQRHVPPNDANTQQQDQIGVDYDMLEEPNRDLRLYRAPSTGGGVSLSSQRKQ